MDSAHPSQSSGTVSSLRGVAFPSRPLVVIPTYNERDNVPRLLPEILESDGRIHILIVDDASPDHTAEAVRGLVEQYPLRLFLESRPRKLGLGSAYVNGFKWGLTRGYDFLIEMDGDWSHHPRYLATMIGLSREADFVIGSRYLPGGGTLNWGAGRKLLSRYATVYSNWILGTRFTDITGGFNGWAGRVLEKLGLDTLRSDGYSFQIELKYKALRSGYRYLEMPILFDERRTGRSKMSVSIALEAAWRVWQFRLGNQRGSRRTPD